MNRALLSAFTLNLVLAETVDIPKIPFSEIIHSFKPLISDTQLHNVCDTGHNLRILHNLKAFNPKIGSTTKISNKKNYTP
jgi:hypothetical protein